MRQSSFVFWGIVAFWFLAVLNFGFSPQACAEETGDHPDHEAMMEGSGSMDPSGHDDPSSAVGNMIEQGATNTPGDQHQHRHEMGAGSDEKGSPNEHEHPPVGLATPESHMEGHQHHHRPPVLPPDEDQAYSELNHHIAGVFVVLAGGLALLAASGNRQFVWARYGWPGLFFLLGVFLFVRHDPESWPWGPLSLWESITDPQVLQHTLFTFIVLGIGVIEWMRCRGTLTHPLWGLIFPTLAISAAVMLFMHHHGEGASADKIYRHHSIMASAGIGAMIAKVLDDSRLSKGKLQAYLWPGLITFIGFMLLIYKE